MKTITPETLRHFGFYSLLIVLFAALLQSCGEAYIQASIDSGHETYDEDGYHSPTNYQVGENIAMIFMSALPGKGMSKSIMFNQNNTVPYYADADLDAVYLSTHNQLNFDKPYDFADHINIMSGLEFIAKGSSDGNLHTHLNYLEVPIYGLYQTPFLTGSAFGGLGPYFAYGIGGSNDAGGNSSPAFGGAAGVNRFDAGLDFTMGYRMLNSFYFNVVYSQGLANIASGAGQTAHNVVWSLNVAYPIDRLLGLAKKK